MASIKDFDKINKKVERAFKVNRRVLANESLKYRLSVPNSCLKNISQVNSLPSANKLPGVQQLKTFGSSETMSKLSDIVKVSNRAAQKLGKWIVDNPDYFTASSWDVKPDIKSSVFLPADMELCGPNAGTNKRLDKLNDSSEKTSELLQLMVDVARSSQETNKQMAALLEELSVKQEDANNIAKAHHAENVQSAVKSEKISKCALRWAIVAAIAGVVSVVLWFADRFDFLSIFTNLL